jgi:hypothetical protein
MSYFGEKGTIKGYAFRPYTANDFLTSDQLKRIDAGESIESILGEEPAQKPKPKPAGGAPAEKKPKQKRIVKRPKKLPSGRVVEVEEEVED